MVHDILAIPHKGNSTAKARIATFKHFLPLDLYDQEFRSMMSHASLVIKWFRGGIYLLPPLIGRSVADEQKRPVAILAIGQLDTDFSVIVGV